MIDIDWNVRTMDYAKVQVSRNQLMELLDQNIPSFEEIMIRIGSKAKVHFLREEVIKLFTNYLNRVEIIQLVHHLTLINRRNSSGYGYVKCMLKGIMSRVNDENKEEMISRLLLDNRIVYNKEKNIAI